MLSWRGRRGFDGSNRIISCAEATEAAVFQGHRELIWTEKVASAVRYLATHINRKCFVWLVENGMGLMKYCVSVYVTGALPAFPFPCLLCSTGVYSLMLEDGKNYGSEILFILRVSLEVEVKCGPVTEGRAKYRCARQVLPSSRPPSNMHKARAFLHADKFSPTHLTGLTTFFL